VSYVPLGSKQVTSVADTTGLNSGNWTAEFTKQVLGIGIASYECYAITVQAVPAFTTVDVYVNTRLRSTAVLIGNAEWDPSQPLLLTPVDEVYFAWSLAASGTPPQVTMWLRYDPTVQPAPVGGSNGS
jgi:hypothetical protein